MNFYYVISSSNHTNTSKWGSHFNKVNYEFNFMQIRIFTSTKIRQNTYIHMQQQKILCLKVVNDLKNNSWTTQFFASYQNIFM